MMGVSAARTAAALDPRSARISVRSRSRIRWIAATDGLISSTAPYRRTLNPQEIEPLGEGNDRGLVLVEDQTSGCQPFGQARLDLFGLPLGVAERDHVVSVSDHHW